MTIEQIEADPQAPTASNVTAQLVDTDVHVIVPDGLDGVYPYMPRQWQRRFELKGARSEAAAPTPRFTHPSDTGLRADATPDSGGVPGSDPQFLVEDLLERHGITSCLINSLEAATFAAALAQPDESVVLCSAYNDYFLERWIPIDRRINYAACVSPQDPTAAAKEIARVAGRPGVAAIFVPLINVLMGNRHYYPIYEAARAHGLPVLTHLSGAESVHQGAPIPAGGLPESFAERRVGYVQYGIANLASLVFSGALTSFPELQFAFIEYGVSWLVPLLWRMDSTWQHTRVETPWLEEPPSEYVRRQVRFATQPLDEPGNPRHLKQLIEMLDPETLLFSTDYPHWDGDIPTQVLKALPSEHRDAVAFANATKCFRLR